jgi:phosphoglycolate phosphatase-like HAD superfamily hydrolase
MAINAITTNTSINVNARFDFIPPTFRELFSWLRKKINGFLNFDCAAVERPLGSRAMIRLVLFDIDGTLVRTGGAGVKAFAKVFATEFGATDHFERLKFAGRTDVNLVREFFLYHSIPPTPENFERFFSRYIFWLDHILSISKTEACPGVWEFIYDLKELSERPLIGLLTGNIRLGAEIKLRHFQLWEAFEIGAFADDSEERDEIAAIARERGCRVLGKKLQADEVLVIGDTPLDIRCGRAIGAKVLAVATGGATLEELIVHKPDWAVPDLRSITAAQVCV